MSRFTDDLDGNQDSSVSESKEASFERIDVSHVVATRDNCTRARYARGFSPHEPFINSVFTKDRLNEKGQARDTRVHVTL